MKYPEYLKRGLLIGSGAIESAHRTVIQRRMKLSGQRWSKKGARRMLNLRTLNMSGHWDRVRKFYQCCDITTVIGIRDRAMLSIYYGCGLRRSEGVGLDTGDVLTRRRLLYVRKGKNYRERYVPINASIIADLQTYLHQARPQLLGKRYTSALLVSERGRRIESLSLSLRLKVLLQRAGIDKPTTLHTLRHSIATHLLQSGMPLQDITRFLGHQSLEATQIYTHLDHEATTGL